MREKLKDRYIIVGMFFILICLAMTFRLAYLQIVRGEYYDAESQRKLLNERKVTAPRGNIFDRNGVAVAVNRQGYLVQMVYTRMKEEDRNRMFLEMTRIFEKNGDSYYKSLNKYLTFNPFGYGTAINKTQDEIDKWIKTTVVDKAKDAEDIGTAEEAFRYLRGKYKISDDISDEDAYRIMTLRYETQIRGYDALNPIGLAKDVSKETVAEIEERHHDFPGVTTEIEPVRKYIDASLAAHIIGYVRTITAEDYKRLKSEGYGMNDIMGQEGIERQAESFLRGKDGLRKVEVDTKGRTTEELDSNPPIPGNDVVLTLDMKLQKVALESLEKRIAEARTKTWQSNNLGDANAGAAVVLDVKTGEILAMASYPSYDPSIFLAGADDKEAQKAIAALFDNNNEARPSINRPIQGLYIPGSTFKPLTAIAALEEGVITPNTPILDPGVWEDPYVNKKLICLEYRDYGILHGWLNLYQAISTSCNIYFYQIGIKTGIDNIAKWAKIFGLGELTGVEIGGEMKGLRASKETNTRMAELYKVRDGVWRPIDTCYTAIGQQDHLYTPLQLANYISAIANGGKLYKPHLIKRVAKYDGSVVNETAREYTELPVKKETLEAVRKGMKEVAVSADGTAYEAFKDFPANLMPAAKTGTPETGIVNHSSNAIFVAYAPADAPQVAVAVAMERGAWGSNAAWVAHDVLAEYFNLNKQGSNDDRAIADEIVFTR